MLALRQSGEGLRSMTKEARHRLLLYSQLFYLLQTNPRLESLLAPRLRIRWSVAVQIPGHACVY